MTGEQETMMVFNGKLVVLMQPLLARRTWFERLFTRPWRPWIAWREEGPPIDPNACYIVGNKMYVGERAYQTLTQRTHAAADPIPQRFRVGH